jgi:hypothetical protein
MNPKNPIFAHPYPTASAYVTGGSLPAWEQVPARCQQELITALATLLLQMPELQPLVSREGCDEPEQ